jgi:hypothetical protein
MSVGYYAAIFNVVEADPSEDEGKRYRLAKRERQ